jgi:AMP-activated protein kinase-like protein
MSDVEDDGVSSSEENRRLEAWLARAPRVAPSPAFQDRVMRALAEPRPRSERLRRFLFSAHTLRWNVAGLATAGALAALALGLGWKLHGSAPSGEEAAPTVSVRFVLHRADATKVRLAGDFTGWQARVPLVRQGDGSWRAEVRLAPGEYEYAFVVDEEHWIQDPAATRFRNDGFGGRNALLLVPGTRRGGYEG